MTKHHKARLAYLTMPEPGVTMLNLQLERDRFMRVQINDNQLRGIILDGIHELRRKTKETAS